MSDTKRFTPILREYAQGFRAVMEPHPIGEYVRHEDYADLERQLTERPAVKDEQVEAAFGKEWGAEGKSQIYAVASYWFERGYRAAMEAE